MGCETWPDSTAYDPCPACGEPTEQFSQVTPLDPEEARIKKLEYEFEEFYQNWDLQHDPDRLKPDDELNKKYVAVSSK